MKVFWRVLGAVALAVLGIVCTTSPEATTSNVAGWLSWLGVNRVPGFLASAATDRVIQIAITILVTVLVCRWWFTRAPKAAPVIEEGPNYNALGNQMMLMARRMRHHRDREWWDRRDPPEEIVAATEALRVTIQKAGFKYPWIKEGMDPNEGIALYIEYLGGVGAMLCSGHIEEAYAFAETLSADHPMPNQLAELAQKAS